MTRSISCYYRIGGGERLYLALYRKYRPRTFEDVISQEHITTTLKNQVASGNTAHAYLFTGSRGTGKTTCAKILAMAVNCLSPKDGSPCLECERCKEIMNGESTDIVEMDAASNNGVSDVRQLRDEVAYTPVSCKYRVYIIDEVHMLSIAAFNALLKTLEEPPAHVKFILATTELHKVPATISSRCQRFEFRRVDIDDSAKRLLEVAEKENVSLDKDAAELISRLSDGGMRDALSLLDRCICADEHITSQIVRDCAGVADNRHLFSFSEMTANRDVAGCIRLLSELHKNSKDIALVIDELSMHYRDLMLYKTAPESTDLLSALPEDYGKIAQTADLYELGDILRCLTLLQQCADNIGKTKQRKTLAEMCLVKMCTGESAEERPRTAVIKSPASVGVTLQAPTEIVPKSYDEMSERERLAAKRTKDLVDKTYEKLKSAEQPAPPEPVPTEPNPPIEFNPVQAEETPPAEDAPPAEDNGFMGDDYPINTDAPAENTAPTGEPADGDIPEERWSEVVSQLGLLYSDFFKGSSAKLQGGVLEVTTSNQMLLNNANGEELHEIGRLVSEKLGAKVKIQFVPQETAVSDSEQDPLDKLLAKARQLGIEVQNKND